MGMQVIAVSQVSADIVLIGRLDLTGSAKIDLPFNATAGSNRNLLMDMSGVTFVASIGIPRLVLGAKTGLLPIARDEAAALAAIEG